MTAFYKGGFWQVAWVPVALDHFYRSLSTAIYAHVEKRRSVTDASPELFEAVYTMVVK